MKNRFEIAFKKLNFEKLKKQVELKLINKMAYGN